MNEIRIAFEDQLSEFVIRKLFSHLSLNFQIVCLNKNYSRTGFGYIKDSINKWNSADDSLLFFVLTDLDKYNCAPELIQGWIKNPIRSNLFFRVAVREVEAWLLADDDNFSKYTGLDFDFIEKETRDVEKITDPKEKLLSLVKRSKKRELITDIVREESSQLKQGPAYNTRLQEYLDHHWDINKARLKSDSLDRALKALEQLQQRAA